MFPHVSFLSRPKSESQTSLIMSKKSIITLGLALVAMTGQAQDANISTFYRRKKRETPMTEMRAPMTLFRVMGWRKIQ